MKNLNRSVTRILFSLLFSVLIISGASCSNADKQSEQRIPDEQLSQIVSSSEKLYEEYCAGCHGAVMTAFTDREWKWGSSDENLYISIAEGRASQAMPAFAESFTDEQITNMIITIREKMKNIDRYKPDRLVDEGNVFQAEQFKYQLEEVEDGFDSPWAMVFLPNSDMLVTDKSGELYRLTNDNKIKIDGVPEVVYEGQGGLMDVEIHPDYENNNVIYLSYSKVNDADGDLATTVVSRFELRNDKLVNGKLIFEALPYVSTRHHYGSRLEFDDEGYLYVTVGDRGRRDLYPQDLSTYPGKVHRIYDDGKIPEDNPFYDKPNAVKSIFSYGHRNQQGMVKNPKTGMMWTHEHGPKGGDEINIIEPGVNYGWPVISYGINYNGTTFTNLTQKEGMAQPIKYWVPSIAPCGIDFITSDKYPGWKGNLLSGSLRFKNVVMSEIHDNKVVGEQILMKGIGRVRAVLQGPDEYIYVAVEDPGIIYKVIPVE